MFVQVPHGYGYDNPSVLEQIKNAFAFENCTTIIVTKELGYTKQNDWSIELFNI